MASITITITNITSQLLDPEDGELSSALINIAGIIEAAAENALRTEEVEYDSIDIETED